MIPKGPSGRIESAASGQQIAKTQTPYVLVEGPEPSQDISYKWVYQLNEIQ